jgi:hypothetical protein
MEEREPVSEGKQQQDPVENAPDALHDRHVPTALVRQVAAELKSLSKVVPYEEYASIVHRIARVKWQCEQAASAHEPDSSGPRPRAQDAPISFADGFGAREPVSSSRA